MRTVAQSGAEYLVPSIHPAHLLLCKRFVVVQLMICLYESIPTPEILKCLAQNKSAH